MAVEVHVRKLEKSWQYDFKFPGRPRDRKGGFRTRQAAKIAGTRLLAKLESGAQGITLADAYEAYMGATRMKDGSRDCYQTYWKRISPVMGDHFIDEIDTTLLDQLKQELPSSWEPKTTNCALSLVRVILRFMWKRGKLRHVPYVPMEPVVTKHRDWYTVEERDRLLEGIFCQYPEWYLFFYLTCRLGLRRSEVYAITHRQVRHIPPRLIIDQQLQPGSRKRPVKVIPRKNNEAFTLEISQDVIDAINWHVARGYAGEQYLFSKTGRFPLKLDSHVTPLARVQRKLGLRSLGHHAIGRHSVASQAATGGEPIKAIQAQLGHRSEKSTHRYAHLGSKAQLGIVTALAAPRHRKPVETKTRVNLASTGKQTRHAEYGNYLNTLTIIAMLPSAPEKLPT